MRVLSIVGARPQFIKHAVIQRKLREYGISEVLLHTGQHFDLNMSEIFFESLSLTPPQIHLQTPLASSLSQLSYMLGSMQERLEGESFDYVLVYGDTTSTLAGSLFAKENGFALAHIEAGLRSYDHSMPEERNRVICDHLSDILFAPNSNALQNLQKEGVRGEVVVSGDIMEEGFSLFLPMAQKPLNVQIPSKFIFCTLHRQSNVDDKERLESLLQGLDEVSKQIPIILPLHPRTQKNIQSFSLSLPSSLIVLPPQGYLQTLWLISHSQMVFTDSGGVQKEASYGGKKCLVLREVSEWVELVESGACELLGERSIPRAYEEIKNQTLSWDKKPLNVSDRIIQSLLKHSSCTAMGEE
ncbi:non-hydrolyzing UDP-N-acetylglucosamine 2-epimerase [Helicobacter brantae]|uniref:UDP-N-acetylglucosamine 2-epimerase (Non-hydrolyzing) n=1 Tax=Helicobacter brantae TaxID=375927 RepID=A0A3D8J2G4_9HELI|nr:UDP-N-acetylglucosamine 2-epimerase (non-hydrolyzing) [Helicobacter brantae]RDU71707.1 UDP-N-acetylglucosamine 2-epimerase (non-hydrolyzing) [Helicobacter brantae]